MVRRALLSSLVLLVACSPAKPSPKIVATAAPPTTTKPEPSRARWLSPTSAEGTAHAQLDLGAAGLLQAGEGGRRWLLAKGKVTSAPFLLPGTILDVRPEGKRLRLLGVDGSVFLVDEPLGSPVLTRPSPAPAAARSRAPVFVAGKRALLGVEADGTLHRSLDGGVTWTKSKLPLLPTEDAVDLAANLRGEVLVLLYPQRVLYSSDDGTTFSPVITPGIGAASVSRDALDELWLEGAIVDQWAKLAGSPRRLEISGAGPAPFAARPKGSEPRDLRQAVGDRIVTVREVEDPTTKQSKISIIVDSFGGTSGTPFVLAESASPSDSVRVAGQGNEIVVDLHRPKATPPISELWRTVDDGKSWQPLGTLEGSEGAAFELAVGPGVVVIGEMCVKKTCTPARVKVGTNDWQPFDIPAHTGLSKVAWDAAHERLVAVTDDPDADDGNAVHVLAGKIGGKLERFAAKPLPFRPHALAFTGAGTLLVVNEFPWHVVEIGTDGQASSPRYLPFAARTAEFVGDHGFAIADEGAFETADAGRHWASVGKWSDVSPTCASAGCVQGEATRLGWDLPDANAKLVAALAQPLDAAPPSPEPGPVLKLACKPTGPFKKLKGEVASEHAALDGDIRLVTMVRTDEWTTGIEVIKGNADPIAIKMLDPAPKNTGKKVVREWTDVSARGVVLVRYSFVGGAKAAKDGAKHYNPVDVELAWYSASTGKVHKASLRALPPFRVGSADPSALHAIVDGGLAFMPHTGEAPLTFVQDDGKSVSIPRPVGADGGAFTDVAKIGNRIVLVQARGDAAALVTSEDLGKTWSTKVWSLGDTGALVTFSGKPALAFGENIAELGGRFGPVLLTSLMPFDAVSADPPPRRALPLPTLREIVACDASARAGLRVYTWTREDRPLEVTLAPEAGQPIDLSTLGRFVRVSAEGASCTDALVVNGSEERGDLTLVARADDLAHAWLARRNGDGDTEIRRVSCSLP